MKKKKLFAALLLMVVCAGCGTEKEQATMVTVDIAGEHSEKEVLLQDFMDVEYIPLETSDEFVTQGSVMDIGDKYLLVKNWANDGDIFVYDRKTGKGIRKINRKGQGAEEYNFINGIILDENNDEMFVNCAAAKKIYVYDLSGNFKRSFAHPKDTEYMDVLNYDKDNLICYDMSVYYKDGQPREKGKSYHSLISKKDGSVTRKIQIPFKELETPVVTKDEAIVTPGFFLITPHDGNCLLTKTSSDTVYNYLPDGTLSPFIVRTPSIHSMDPKVFLFPTIITDRYYFMQTLDKKFNFEKGRGFPTNDLVYDKQEKAIFQYTVYNDDFSNKHRVALGQQPEKSVDEEIVTCRALNASDLVEANEKGELKGKLKEIAAGLNEESNSVIMLIKRKK